MTYSSESIKILVESTLTEIIGDVNSNELIFVRNDGRKIKMCHWQDCCEQVDIVDICGDLSDLIGSPITLAEVRTEDDPECDDYGIGMFTFYEIATIKGSVTIRWHGSSNGYYGVGVDVSETD